MKKMLFLSLLIFATLLAACDRNEVINQTEQNTQVVPELPPVLTLDEFVFTEQFDTLTCESPELVGFQKTSENGVANGLEIKIDNWRSLNFKSVEIPAYVIYFVAPPTHLAYVPSGVYTTAAKDDSPWKIKYATKEVWLWDDIDDYSTLAWLNSEQIHRCCMQLEQKGERYDVQMWLEMNTEPYFRYIHINQKIDICAGSMFAPCDWWKLYF